MTRQLFTWTAFLASTIVSFGQDYLNNERAEIIKKIHGLFDSTYTVSISQTIVQINPFNRGNFNDTVLHYDTIANLKVSIDGKIEFAYFFDTFDNTCDSIVIKYCCCECADTCIKGFLSDKDRKWKQLGTDNYISRRQTNKSTNKDPKTSRIVTQVGSPQMTIKRTPNNPVCAAVYFYIPMMDKDKWKELTKK